MSEQMKERRYLYGVSLDGIAVLEHVGIAAEAEAKAEELVVSIKCKTPSDPEAETELQRGSVAIHRDGAEHFAIVLETRDQLAAALREIAGSAK